MRIQLSDSNVEKLKPDAGIVRDKTVPGFFVVVGKNRKTLRFQRDTRDAEGKRRTESINLGVFGKEYPFVTVDEAREKALHLLGKTTTGEFTLRPPKSITLEKAFKAYAEDMRARGRSEKWIHECQRNFKRNLSHWANESLLDLSNRPLDVRDWHQKIAMDHGNRKGRPSEANHAGRLLRQTYNNAAGALDRTLPAANPTSAIRWCAEGRANLAIPFDEFPAWAKQVAAVEKEAPLRAAFHRLCVLTGLRPGSLARLKWIDIDCKRRSIHIGKFKTEIDVTVPMSWPIARELRRARDDGRIENERLARTWVFPSIKSKAGHLMNWLADDVDHRGNAGRHSYRTIAADLGIDELTTQLLQGHSLQSISHGYITRQVMVQGLSLRGAQRRMSRRILGLMAGGKAKSLPKINHGKATLAPSGEGPSNAKAKPMGRRNTRRVALQR